MAEIPQTGIPHVACMPFSDLCYYFSSLAFFFIVELLCAVLLFSRKLSFVCQFYRATCFLSSLYRQLQPKLIKVSVSYLEKAPIFPVLFGSICWPLPTSQTKSQLKATPRCCSNLKLLPHSWCCHKLWAGAACVTFSPPSLPWGMRDSGQLLGAAQEEQLG